MSIMFFIIFELIQMQLKKCSQTYCVGLRTFVIISLFHVLTLWGKEILRLFVIM